MARYIITHDGKQYDPNGKVTDMVTSAEQHNRSINESQLSIWAQKPERFVAYIVSSQDGLNDMGKATTWKGSTLGYVVASKTYRNNLTGSRMRFVRICGTNGATYYGTQGCDWSQAIRLRKVKSA